MNESFDCTQRRIALGAGEAILWKGKPKRSAFVAQRSLTLLPIAVIWMFLDIGFIASAFNDGELLWFIIPFFALHMMPVWLWLGSMITAGRRWKNTTYFVTNRRIIIQGGFFAVNETSLFYKDIPNVQVHIGLFGKLFNTGSVVFDSGMVYRGRKQDHSLPSLEALEDPQGVYSRIQKIVLDIQTDIEYPNALRPSENPGYQTDYTP